MFKVHKLAVGTMQSNCYIVEDDSSCLIVDPGDDADYISNKLISLHLKPIAVIATHGHFDHNMASFELTSSYNIPFYIDKEDKFLIENIASFSSHWLKRDDVLKPEINIFKENSISMKNVKLKIIKIPGHTPGSVAFYIKSKRIVFSGDLIFEGGGLGRTDFSYSSKPEFSKSIHKILSLPKNTLVYPGHGESFKLSDY